MKTPEEIKRSLKRCTDVCYGRCKECVYGENDPSECVLRLSGDALAYIIRLEAERDALLEYIKNSIRPCNLCKYDTEDAYAICHNCVDEGNWEWRGVQEVAEDE